MYRNQGFATISFDAFEMNDFDDWRWVNRKIASNSKQRMIFSVLEGAFQYTLKKIDWDTEKIYLYGQSNGGRVVVAAQKQLTPLQNIKGNNFRGDG